MVGVTGSIPVPRTIFLHSFNYLGRKICCAAQHFQKLGGNLAEETGLDVRGDAHERRILRQVQRNLSPKI